MSEFAKSRAMRAMLASMVYVPTCQTCQKRANFSFLSANVRINVPTCQRAKGVPIIQLGVRTWQRRAIVPNGVPIFQLFFKRIFQFLNFSNIWAILENLSRETKNLNFDI